jgi:hypothetical protein
MVALGSALGSGSGAERVSVARGWRRAGAVPRGRPAGDRRFGSGRFASGTGYFVSTENRGKARSPA